VLIPSSHIHSLNSWRKFPYGKQHYDKDHNKNNEGESSVLNPIKRWSHYERLYHGETGNEKDNNTNVLGKSSNNEIEESGKRRRLNWGEGLTKYEKKKREVEGLSVTSAAVAATPTSTSVACSFLSGMLLDSLWCFF